MWTTTFSGKLNCCVCFINWMTSVVQFYPCFLYFAVHTALTVISNSHSFFSFSKPRCTWPSHRKRLWLWHWTCSQRTSSSTNCVSGLLESAPSVRMLGKAALARSHRKKLRLGKRWSRWLIRREMNLMQVLCCHQHLCGWRTLSSSFVNIWKVCNTVSGSPGINKKVEHPNHPVKYGWRLAEKRGSF